MKLATQPPGLTTLAISATALSGSGTDQQLLIFEEYAKNVEADLVILGIPIHNIDRIKAAYRPTLDRITRQRLLVPKPYFSFGENGILKLEMQMQIVGVRTQYY